MRRMPLAVVISISLCFALRARANDLSLPPSIPGVPGETGHLFLNKRALLVHPFSNDTGGTTDKLFSFGSYVGVLGSISRLGYESRLHWRMITPSFQDKRDVTPIRSNPIGRYADWLEAQTGLSYTTQSGIGLALNYGVGRAGGQSARDVQHWWHGVLGVKSNKRLTWDNQLLGRRDSFGGELRVASSPKSDYIQQIWAAGYQKNLLLEEAYTRSNLVFGKPGGNGLTCAVEFVFARPLGGELDSDYAKIRFESGFGCRLFSAITPAVRYVSPYVKGDVYPQIYYDLFNIQHEF
jgi:hypothetical protein